MSEQQERNEYLKTVEMLAAAFPVARRSLATALEAVALDFDEGDTLRGLWLEKASQLRRLGLAADPQDGEGSEITTEWASLNQRSDDGAHPINAVREFPCPTFQEAMAYLGRRRDHSFVVARQDVEDAARAADPRRRRWLQELADWHWREVYLWSDAIGDLESDGWRKWLWRERRASVQNPGTDDRMPP